MRFQARLEPRWPAFAIGFHKSRGRRYDTFSLIIWALVLEVKWP